MYRTLPSFVLGFHGCDKSVGLRILNQQDKIKPSENDYDWLGNGFYFWENNPSRALEYAKSLQKAPHSRKQKIKEPFALGAVIDLGKCLNLLDTQNFALLRAGYSLLKQLYEKKGEFLPENKPFGNTKDLIIRKLDCAVIESVAKRIKFDSVRGMFAEGKELYPGAGFKSKNHIQICVRNPNCIKGFFLPREKEKHFPIP